MVRNVGASFIYTLVFLSALFSGCRPIRKDDSSEKFRLLAGMSEPKLMTAMKNESIRICVKAADREIDVAKWKKQIERAVLTWVDAVRKISSRPLARVVEIADEDCHQKWKNFDSAVVLTHDTRKSQHHYNQSVTYFNTKDSRGYPILLHELGHAVGLADTYSGDGDEGKCANSQPQSVMCNASFVDLQLDDKIGVRALYYLFNENDVSPELRQRFRRLGLFDILKAWAYKSPEELRAEEDESKLIQDWNMQDKERTRIADSTSPELQKELDKLRFEKGEAGKALANFRGPLESRAARLEWQINERKDQGFDERKIAMELRIPFE